ncbi:hypothetical protein U27_05750 [Candidatus Vecturithrix granuli]|uniref:Peptidase A2 domain-containing protein n=1 Tax=Vecturithrix granuli TaxID=1499967 RepID=A0A081C2H0_VECG1|nr:hypothetical protein U27_05750 [Candidatus Vecturithrix granuli]
MQTNTRRFPFTDPRPGSIKLPFLPMLLTYQGRSVSVSGLLDTGATVNVLPYDLGIQLGAVWDRLPAPVRLTGNLGGYEARSLIVSATVEPFAPVKLVFAWTQHRHVPVILGQMNFFREFDVYFFGSQTIFEIAPKQQPD